jgi:hypothetical protein
VYVRDVHRVSLDVAILAAVQLLCWPHQHRYSVNPFTILKLTPQSLVHYHRSAERLPSKQITRNVHIAQYRASFLHDTDRATICRRDIHTRSCSGDKEAKLLHNGGMFSPRSLTIP